MASAFDVELKNVPTTKAYKSADFLSCPASRHIRVMCELEEPRNRLDKSGIDHYFIVVGTHLVMPPEERSQHIQELEQQVKQGGPEEEMESLQAKLRFAKKLQPMDKYYSTARELGNLIAKWNKERVAKGLPSYHVSTGGGPGVMEAANRGAREAGEMSLGFGASRPEWGSLNKYVSEEGAFEFHYLFMRKFLMAYKCKGLIVLPGGLGSFDELFEMLVLIKSNKIKRLSIILIGEQHWKRAFNFEYMLECGMLTQAHLDLVVFKDSAEEAFNHLVEQATLSELSSETTNSDFAKRRRLEAGTPHLTGE